MLFTSMEFLFLFLPITIAVYFFLPCKARNYWLLAVSLFFYAWGEPVFVITMLVSILYNYFAALRIEELEGHRLQRRLILAVSVAVNLGLLFVYKYLNFVTANLHKFFPATQSMFEQTEFVLPIGISFFTFQALSYVIDVYRGVPAQKNPAYIGLYISFFPQLIAGPIVRYTTIMDQIEHREITPGAFSQGVLRFLYGFNKKVLLANLLASVVDTAFASGELSVAMAWLGAICYSMQIFFDFSGYSEMAIGLGQMFGFKFLENFNYPYISRSVTEFWRRWHISLGTWFRDYLYFPLGGSRVNSKARLVFNLAVVWLATGIWHGANWTFILWGVLHGAVIIFEKLLSIPERAGKRVLSSAVYRIITLLVVVAGWVLFRADGLAVGLNYLCVMFGLSGNASVDAAFLFNLREYFVIIAAGIICSTPVLKFVKTRLSLKFGGGTLCDGLGLITQLALFIISVSFLVMNAHNPFIYFNF